MFFKKRSAAEQRPLQHVIVINKKGATDINGRLVTICEWTDQKEVSRRFIQNTAPIKQWLINGQKPEILDIKIIVETHMMSKFPKDRFIVHTPNPQIAGNVIFYTFDIALDGRTYRLTDIYKLAGDKKVVSEFQKSRPLIVGPVANNLDEYDDALDGALRGQNEFPFGWGEGSPSGWLSWDRKKNIVTTEYAACEVLNNFATRIPTPDLKDNRAVYDDTRGPGAVLHPVSVLYGMKKIAKR
ncbi:MAG: hypothetical protein FWE17_01180 [Alphaproteobacteria bacterium]|nr:hypothetical protein [Alphaproteobacteria bacterium]MCL2758536.1 hypothetical protein [Alphaproteobacteria bacterium]